MKTLDPSRNLKGLNPGEAEEGAEQGAKAGPSTLLREPGKTD
jgi:hypothetical protein